MGKKSGKFDSFEMVTEAKIIEIQHGILRGTADRIQVDVCIECGAGVFDVIQHWKWHNPGK